MRYDQADRESTNVEDRRPQPSILDRITQAIWGPPIQQDMPLVEPTGLDAEPADLSIWSEEGNELLRRANERRVKQPTGPDGLPILPAQLPHDLTRAVDEFAQSLAVNNLEPTIIPAQPDPGAEIKPIPEPNTIDIEPETSPPANNENTARGDGNAPAEITIPPLDY